MDRLEKSKVSKYSKIIANIVAFHEQTLHRVAIKILNKRRIRQYGVFEKVKRELKILRRFNNPHTIKLFEFIDTQSEIFMVLEYAAGGELFDLIARRERVSTLCKYDFRNSSMRMKEEKYFNKLFQVSNIHIRIKSRTET